MGIALSSSEKEGWDSDSFEDQVASTVVGLYERPTSITRSNWPSANLADIQAIRACGAFVQHPNRMVFDDELDSPVAEIYDGHFVEAFVVGGERCKVLDFVDDSYVSFNSIRRALSPRDGFYSVAPGDVYCFIGMSATDGGDLQSEKHYFTARGSAIYPCAIDNGRTKRFNYVWKPPALDGLSMAENVHKRVIMLLNTISDRRHQWSIQANESHVGVELQCYHEEVKSLLYARSLPMTATGRKRPVLHLVSAHRRRIKEGIDINIDQFLRGVRKVEMGGAIFQVKPPLGQVEKIEAAKAAKAAKAEKRAQIVVA